MHRCRCHYVISSGWVVMFSKKNGSSCRGLISRRTWLCHTWLFSFRHRQERLVRVRCGSANLLLCWQPWIGTHSKETYSTMLETVSSRIWMPVEAKSYTYNVLFGWKTDRYFEGGCHQTISGGLKLGCPYRCEHLEQPKQCLRVEVYYNFEYEYRDTQVLLRIGC